MEKPSQKSLLLVLFGVRLSDFIATPTAPKDTVDLDCAYTALPTRFCGADKWPQTTNLHCWYCDRVNRSYPKFIPLNLERANGLYVSDVRGHFDTWNCAIRYILTEIPEFQRADLIDAVRVIEQLFTGTRRVKIMPAVSKTRMQKYVGAEGITESQYVAEMNSLNAVYKMTDYKLEHICGEK